MVDKGVGQDSKGSGQPRRLSIRAFLERKISRNLRPVRRRVRRQIRRWTALLTKPSKRATLKRKILGNPVIRRVLVWRVALSVEHLHGPRNITYGADELVVICIVRNGRPYIKSSINHYLSLGVKHIVFLDNGSDDGTVAVAREHARVTVIQTKLSYKKYEGEMIHYLISRFGKGRWSLYVDIDELFDYPYSDIVRLSSLLRYLNEKSYTAVVTQVLDMFPDRVLSSQVSQNDEPLTDSYKFYDLSNIKREDYHDRRGRRSNVLANNDIKILKDGIRSTLFDAPFLLTNHRLIFFDGKTRPGGRGLHRIENARVADFSCVLYHYKLVDGFREWAARIAREENYTPDLMLRHYRKYHEVMERNPDFVIRQDTARELESVNELIDNGFLVVSEAYKSWAESKKKNRAAPS